MICPTCDKPMPPYYLMYVWNRAVHCPLCNLERDEIMRAVDRAAHSTVRKSTGVPA